jgi:hypothetical protein
LQTRLSQNSFTYQEMRVNRKRRIIKIKIKFKRGTHHFEVSVRTEIDFHASVYDVLVVEVFMF